MSAAKTLLTVATLALLGTGGYAYWTRTLLRTSQDVVAQRAQRPDTRHRRRRQLQARSRR